MITKRSGEALVMTLRYMHRKLNLLEMAGVYIASIGILVAMCVTAVDVFMRYVMGSPLEWWYDFLMNYVIIAIFYLSFSYTLAHHGHLTVGYFAGKMPLRFTYIAFCFGLLIGSIFFYLIGKSAVQESIAAYVNNDVQFGVILWPVWITKAFIAYGILTLALRCLHFFICYLIASIDSGVLERIGIASGVTDLDEAS